MKHLVVTLFILFSHQLCTAQIGNKIKNVLMENRTRELNQVTGNKGVSDTNFLKTDSLGRAYEEYSRKFTRINVNAIDSNDMKSSRQLARSLFTPLSTSNSPFINDKANVSLESQFGEQFASASIGVTTKNMTYSAEVKQPFQEKPKEVNPFSLDGLDNGTSFKMGLQWNISYLKSDDEIRRIFNEVLREFCKRKPSMHRIPCDSLITKITDDKTEYYYKRYDTLIKLDSLKKTGCCCCNNNESEGVLGFYIDTSLNYAAISSFAFDDLDSIAQQSFFERIHVKRWFIGGSAAIAKTSFDYIKDSFTVTPTLNESHINQSYKLNVGYIIKPEDKDKMSVLALSFVYSLGYEAGSDPAEYSFPIGTQGLTYAKSVSIGTPTQTTNTRLALEYRKKWNIFSNHPIAVSPSVSYLFDKKTLAVILPVYLFQYKKDDKIAGLQGGFRLGYRTITNGELLTSFSKGFSASVFIAAPFDLFSF